jgi:hypothetical protein
MKFARVQLNKHFFCYRHTFITLVFHLLMQNDVLEKFGNYFEQGLL